MKKLIVSLFMLALGVGLMANDVEAARLGGGRSLGAQRQITRPRSKRLLRRSSNSRPRLRNRAGRWFAPLAGLAAGIGLGWLFAQGGFGPRDRRASHGPACRCRCVRFDAFAVEAAPAAIAATVHRFGQRDGGCAAALAASGGCGRAAELPQPVRLQYPGGFRRRGFSLKESRRNFLRLQEANDRGDLARLRQVTTEDMFNTLKDDVAGHSGAQQTDVVTLNASLLELVTEGELYWASVRFFPVRSAKRRAHWPSRSRRSGTCEKPGERRLGLAARRIAAARLTGSQGRAARKLHDRARRPRSPEPSSATAAVGA